MDLPSEEFKNLNNNKSKKLIVAEITELLYNKDLCKNELLKLYEYIDKYTLTK